MSLQIPYKSLLTILDDLAFIKAMTICRVYHQVERVKLAGNRGRK